ncbi:MAG: hypothetical protein H6722_15315 [Sandaracinus sp.]|nr:hypothetical protein [Sandaracinus sp.]MCB9613812.1 hypothetical protein [Sandaracinus sp.]MCB9624757.1 hypothetical protein [Sandaracinus sp.]
MASFECQACGARVEIEDDRRTGKCLYCGSPQVIDRPPSADRPSPTFGLAFVVTPERALETARAFVRRPFFAPTAFRKAKVDDVRGIYLPAYLYTAVAHTQYEAQIGENYTVTETYTTTQNGKTVTRTRTRVKTEWRGLSGRCSTFVGDHVVSASRGLPNAELESIEPFDWRAIKRYAPRLISGWATEEPTLAPAEVAHEARTEASNAVGARLARFMPGDSHRALRWQTTFEHEDLELVLVPLWILPVRYREDKAPVRLLVNGQTGRVHAKTPTSWVKVTVAVVLGIALLTLAIWLLMERR